MTSFGGPGAVEGAATLSLKGLLKGIFTPLSVLGADSAEAKRDYPELDGLGRACSAAEPACST